MTKGTRQKEPDERAAAPPDPKLEAAKTHAPSISHPHPTILGEHVIQCSPSVTTPLQNLPHINRTTTRTNQHPQTTHNTKHKRSSNNTLDMQATRDKLPPETQQNTDR